MNHRIALRVALVALLLAACDSGGSGATTTTLVATTTASVPVVGVDAIALEVVGDAMGADWVEELFLPYGDTEDTLGTSPGGEGGSLDLGPEYGAQAPDGTWWFLDAAKTRLARFGADGAYLGAVALPADLLVGGVYFQFQLPRVLADGTLVAFGFRVDSTAMLRAAGSGVDQAMLAGTVLPRVDDGVLAYGFDDTGALLAVDPIAGTAQPAEWMRTQAGTRFHLEVTEGGLRIVLPDAPITVDRVLQLVTAADATIPAFGGIQVTGTADGSIHVLILGSSSADETAQLGGLVTILPDGTVTAPVPVRNPFTSSDPGSPAQLGAAFGAENPWFMVVDTDGVRVYRLIGYRAEP